MKSKQINWKYSKDNNRRYRWRTVNWRGYLQLYLDVQTRISGDIWSDTKVNCLYIPPEVWFDIQRIEIPEFPLKNLPTKF